MVTVSYYRIDGTPSCGRIRKQVQQSLRVASASGCGFSSIRLPTDGHRDEKPISGSRLRWSGLGRAVRPRSPPALWSSAGTESGVRLARPVRAPQANVEASSCEGSGLRPGVCRDARSELTAGNPSGTEVSSGPADSCRPQGRGVEEARGTPRTGTARQPPASLHSSRTFCTGSRRRRLSNHFDEKDTAGLPTVGPWSRARVSETLPAVASRHRSRGETPRCARRMLASERSKAYGYVLKKGVSNHVATPKHTERVDGIPPGRERSERPVATDN